VTNDTATNLCVYLDHGGGDHENGRLGLCMACTVAGQSLTGVV